MLNVAPDITPENAVHRLDLRIAKTFNLDKQHSANVLLIVQNALQDNFTKYGTTNPVAQALFSRRGWLTATFNF